MVITHPNQYSENLSLVALFLLKQLTASKHK